MTSRSIKARIERRLAFGVLGLPPWLIRRLAGAPIVREGRRLDPQIQLMLRLQHLASGGKTGWAGTSLSEARRQLTEESDLLSVTPALIARIESLQFEGPAGAIPARLYRPAGCAQAAPALIYYHGGGFVLGNLDSHDTPCRQIASQVGCVVISIDYRLAPEHRFPAGPLDAIAAFRGVARQAQSLGLDPTRLAVGGDSAGGNLAAVVAQQTRKDQRRPCFQLLIYPTTDLSMSFPSIRTFANGFLLTRASMDWFLEQYLPPGQDKRDPLGSPLYGDVSGLPPALVQTAGFDPLSDEGAAYAQHMEAAGVRVTHVCYEGLVHSYMHLAGSVKAARQPYEDLRQALQQAFAPNT